MESNSVCMNLIDEEEMVATKDWRKALRAQPAYRIVNRTIRGQTLFVYLVGLTGLFCLIFLYTHSSNRSTSGLRSGNYNYTYPLTRPIKIRNIHSFRIGIIADLDTNSMMKDQKNIWCSYFKTGYLNYNSDSHSVVVTWDIKDPELLKTSYALKGRGAELSELVTFNGRLLTFDDRTGIVFDIIKNELVPWLILMDGDGKNQKGFKSEWAAVKDELLYVGSMGKEWTSASGEFANNNPQYVKVITDKGQINHINWIEEYKRIREVLGIYWPGYMIHESGTWSNVHRRWFFLPRRCSKETYNESLDEHRGCSVLISANEDMADIKVVQDALTSYEEEKLTKAISTLKEVEKRCATETGWLKHVTQKVFRTSDPQPQKSLAEQLETQIILADSQVCIAILTFLQQEISGYLRGGWVLRKAWKVYEKVYKEILDLYKKHVGELHLPDPDQTIVTPLESPTEGQSSCAEWEIPENLNNGYIQKYKIPQSKSAILHNPSNHYSLSPSKNSITKEPTVTSYSVLKKSYSINSNLSHTKRSSWRHFNSSFSFHNISSLFSSHEINTEQQIENAVIIRLMGAVSFGYGLFQLGISLLPPTLMRLIHILGFGANRRNGIACLMYARLGSDMRSPLATLSLLWYHTIVRPYYAIDGTNVQAGVDASMLLLKESEDEFRQSTLFLFFRGRVCRLNSDIEGARKAFQEAVENANQREINVLCMHEVGWCHLIELDYGAAQAKFLYLKSSSRWSRAFYSYLAAVCTGASQDISQFSLFEDLKNITASTSRSAPLDEFLTRRCKYCPTDLEGVKEKKPIFWKLLIFEMLYLWNALPSCSSDSVNVILRECVNVSEEKDEPMLGLSKLILGCVYCIQRQYENALASFRKCLELRKNISSHAEDAHVSAFSQYELGSLLLRNDETKEEGKILLQLMNQYSRYDFEQKLNVRVHSLLKQS